LDSHPDVTPTHLPDCACMIMNITDLTSLQIS